MSEDRDVVLFRIDRKSAILLAGVLAVALGGFAMAETLTLTTSYPVPSGIYNQLITTGNSGLTPADTTLNRSAGNTILAPDATNAGGRVGIGTTSPGSKLEVSGTATVTNLQINAIAAAGTSCSSNGLVARDAAGSIVSCVGGIWKSLAGGKLVQMYKCPGPVSLGGGKWGYYGCQNQITNTPTCYEVEYPKQKTFNCEPVGKMALY